MVSMRIFVSVFVWWLVNVCLTVYVSIFTLVVSVLHRMAMDWWLAKHLKSGKVGYIPNNYVCTDDNSHEAQE